MNYIDFDLKNLQKFEFEETAVSDGSLVGTCELGKANIQLLNDSNEYSSFKGKWIKTIHGSFYVYDVKPIQEKVNIQLSCYDIKYKLDVPYEQQKFDSLFPCAIKTWRKAIAEEYGIIFNDNDNFPFADLVLITHPFVGDKPSVRNVIQVIAQACISFIETDEKDNFYFSWVKSNEPILIKDWLELTTEQKATDPVNEAVLGRGDVEDIVIWPKPAPENPKEFRIDNNYILDPQDTESDSDRRLEVIKDVYDRVNGFSYVIYDMRTQSADDVFAIKLGSKIKYIDIWGNEIESIVMSKTLIWLGGDINDSDNYELKISAEQVNETSSELSYAGDINDTIDKLSVSVDKNNKKIELLASSTSELSEKVTKVEETAEGVKSTVTNIEKGLADTNTNLQNTDKKVKGLEDNLNGLSTNFNDFKDNEYVKDKQYLQDQIDGAIQFWNGSEIPTLNNFPASDWKTEADKNNHRADIYTVIEDIEGELKQGKSYRFDKVNGVWQWVELTDNELSAVQALAQQGLDKATENEKNIGVLNQKTSELSQSDEEIKASVEELDNQYKKDMTVENVAYGNPAYIDNASNNSLISNIIYGASEQKTRSGKNKYNYIDVAYSNANINADEDGWFTINVDNTAGSNVEYARYIVNPLSVKENTQYNLIIEIKENNSTGGNISFSATNDIGQFSSISNTYTPNLKSNTTYQYTITSKENFDNVTQGLYVYSSTSVGIKTSIKFRISLLEDTTITPENFVYEEYGVMPSPEFPSEMKNVEGIENLLDIDFEDFEKGGLSFKNNHNGTITINGVNTTGAVQLDLSSKLIEATDNEKITLSYKVISGSVNMILSWVCLFFPSDGASNRFNITDIASGSNTITFTKGTRVPYIHFGSRSADKQPYAEFDNYTIALQIEKGEVAHSNVPYGNKYLIERVTGKNVFNTIFEQGTINNVTGQPSSSSSNVRSVDFTKVKPNSEYIFSADGIGKSINVFCYDKDQNFINLTEQGSSRSYINVSPNKSFVVTPNTFYIKFFKGKEELSKVQVELGNQITNYEEYQEKTYLIPLKKENLFDSSLFEEFTSSIKYLTLNLKPNTYYTLISDIPRSSSNVGNLFLLNSSTSASTGKNDVYNNIPCTIKTLDDGIIRIGYRDNSSDYENEATAYYYKLYEGTNSDDYYFLGEASNIKDEYDIASGVLTKRIGKVVLTGNENFLIGNPTYRLYGGLNLPLATVSLSSKCNYYTGSSEQPRSSQNNILWLQNINNQLRLNFYDKNYDGDAYGFKKFLKDQYNAGTPVIVEYVLHEPYTIQLNPIEVKTLSGENNIYVEDKHNLVDENKLVYLTDSFLNTQYVSKSEFKATAESITSEVNRKVSSKDFDETIEEVNTRITQTADDIKREISAFYNLTMEGESSDNLLNFNNVAQGSPIIIKIRPLNENITYLYPNTKLFPSDLLFPKIRLLRFENTITNEVVDYELPDDLLFFNKNVYDEFEFDYEKKICQVVKRCGYNADGTVYQLKEPITKEFDIPNIMISKGNYKVYLPTYESAYIYTKMVISNDYTNLFATKVETNNAIVEARDGITTSVNAKISEANGDIKELKGEMSLKLNVKDLITVFNLAVNQVIINSDNFKLDPQGNITLKNGARIISGEGMMTNLDFEASDNGTTLSSLLGYMQFGLDLTGDYDMQEKYCDIIINAIIPKNFTIVAAVVTLFEQPVDWHWETFSYDTVPSGSLPSGSVTGKVTNPKVLRLENPDIALNFSGAWLSEGVHNPTTGNYQEISNFTSISKTGKIPVYQSDNIAKYLQEGVNTLILRTSEKPTIGRVENTKHVSENTCYAKAILNVYGFLAYD